MVISFSANFYPTHPFTFLLEAVRLFFSDVNDFNILFACVALVNFKSV